MPQANESSPSAGRTSQASRYDRYVGRVGALAVALGVGAALGGTPGTAWAGPEAPSDEAGPPPASAPESPGTGATGSPTVGGTTSSNGQRISTPGSGTDDEAKSPRTTVDVSGGANATINGQPVTSTNTDLDEDPADDPVAKPAKPGIDDESQTDTEKPHSNTGPSPKTKNDDTRPQATPSPADPVTAVADTVTSFARAVLTLGATTPTPTPTVASPTLAVTPTLTARTASVIDTPAAAPQSTGIAAVVTQLVSSVFAPLLTPGPESPAASPALFTILSFVRREFESFAGGFGTQDQARTSISQTSAPAALARTAAPVALAAAAAPPAPAPTPVLTTVGFVVTGVGNVVGGILGFLGGIIGGVFNAPPTASPQITNVDSTSGVVTGQLNATDPNNDTLTYQVTTQAGKGTATVDPAGTFVYTPSASARATALATPGLDYDSFTINITDARGAKTAVTVNNVPVTPANRAPVSSGPPSITSVSPAGVVTGNLNVSDPDGDSLNYTFPSTPSKGTISLQSNGVFTYTPTPQARIDAFNSVGPDSDSFTVVVSDGRGGTRTVPVGNIPVTPSAGAYTATINLQPNSIPRSEAISPDGSHVYVTHDNANLISVIDTASNTVTAVPVNDRPRAIVISPDGKRVYYTAYGHVSVFDTQSNSVVAQADVTPDGSDNSLFAYDVALSTDGTRAFVVAGTDDSTALDGQVAILDTMTKQIVDRIPLHDATPIAVETASDGRHVYVISQGPQEAHLLVVNATTKQVEKTLVFGQQGDFVNNLTLSPDGTKLYVSGSTLFTVDTATNQVIGKSNTVNRKVAVSGDGKRLYYADSTRLSVFDVATGTLVDRIAIPTATPNQASDAEVVLAPDGSKAYVTGYYENTVSVVSLTPH